VQGVLRLAHVVVQDAQVVPGSGQFVLVQADPGVLLVEQGEAVPRLRVALESLRELLHLFLDDAQVEPGGGQVGLVASIVGVDLRQFAAEVAGLFVAL
jgi:hypothetical protein